MSRMIEDPDLVVNQKLNIGRLKISRFHWIRSGAIQIFPEVFWHHNIVSKLLFGMPAHKITSLKKISRIVNGCRKFLKSAHMNRWR